MSLEFRLIGIEKRDPFTIAAMDHAIFEECEAGKSPPTLVYHNWESSVSIASAQPLSDLNHQECSRLGFKVVRMRSGGKAVVHFPDTEFTYSLFVPVNSIFEKDQIYQTYCGRIAKALENLSLPTAVVDNNDIFIDNKKIGGNAQRLNNRYSMQQGLILYEKPNAQIMLNLMNNSLYLSSALDELNNILTGFNNYSNINQEELRKALTEQITDSSYHIGELTNREKSRIDELIPEYKDVKEIKSSIARGLCWLPAPSYLARKQEVPQYAQS
ncbi:MAG: hypothetical protein Q8Q35_02040 [Nanoarchaeota archaeon]|nr:hypothetical protein [Nanoarchaeota archaeon]